MMMATKKNGWKSLARLIECLEGEEIVLELKDGLEVRGLVDGVQLNDLSIMLGKAKQRWVEGKQKGRIGPDLELVLIAGKRIRYIRFPEKMDLDQELERWEARKEKARFKRNFIVDRPKASQN